VSDDADRAKVRRLLEAWRMEHPEVAAAFEG
jgi:hypothetical protein